MITAILYERADGLRQARIDRMRDGHGWCKHRWLVETYQRTSHHAVWRRHGMRVEPRLTAAQHGARAWCV